MTIPSAVMRERVASTLFLGVWPCAISRDFGRGSIKQQRGIQHPCLVQFSVRFHGWAEDLTTLINRWDDYQRCVSDPAVPWDNNPAEQTIRMPKLRTKVSGCLRTLSRAEQFAAIHSYSATAVRHGHNMLHVLIQAADGHPWIHAT